MRKPRRNPRPTGGVGAGATRVDHAGEQAAPLITPPAGRPKTDLPALPPRPSPIATLADLVMRAGGAVCLDAPGVPHLIVMPWANLVLKAEEIEDGEPMQVVVFGDRGFRLLEEDDHVGR